MDRMKQTIQEICDNIGPREPCSENEAKCAEYIKDRLKHYTNFSIIEDFFCSPGSYKFSIRLPMISLVFITFFYWIYFFYPYYWSLIIICILNFFTFTVIQTNLTKNIELIDPLFKKKKSTNVYAKFKPVENSKPKNLILIGGHHDSNYEFKIIRKSIFLFGLVITTSIILNYILFVIFIIKIIFYFFGEPYLIIPLVDLIILVILTILAPLYIYSGINIISNSAVPGANDNLTSIAIILEIAKYLKVPNILRNTEVWLVSHGCEEIGDRGSKRFAKKHYSELKNALVINIDMVGGKNSELRIDIMEETYLIKLYKKLGIELSKIASELKIPHTLGNVEAFTDSMAYSRIGIKACSLIGIPHKGLPAYYHTREDTIDKLDFNKLYNCFQIIIEFLLRIDQGKINI